MIGKIMYKQIPKGRYHDRLVWRLIALAAVLVGNFVGCQQISSPTPSVLITIPPTSALITLERPTSFPQNQTSPTRPLRPMASDTDAFKIKFRSRQFVPEAEIRSGLDWLRTVPYRHVHVILQLYEPPDSAARTLLEQSGILLLNYIPSNTWFASIPNSLQIDAPALTLVRWFGPILPEDKLPAELLSGSIGSWALREGNKVALEVTFFEDVDLEYGRQLLLKYDAVVISMTALSNKMTIEIPKDAILSIATEDIVRWIDVVPPPPTTNSEGG